jgi:two-component system, chemotaxis family, sensor kinase CheA
MLLFNRLKVGSKLLLLAGVPVLGILALSALVILDVRERAHAAAGLGSIEDLAQLTEKMLHVIDELQWERAEVTYHAGTGSVRGSEVQWREQRTDAALRELSTFLKQRDEDNLPAKLRQDLKAAHQQLTSLSEFRSAPQREEFELLAYLEFFAHANDSLIRATAALTQLSEDKELLLSIGGLVSAMQVIERNAREHALLNYVFGKQEFPPGTFRYMVTLLTEQEVYTESLRTWANEEEFTRLRQALKGPMVEKILGMRQIALETTEGALEVDANVWFETQSANMEALTRMERDMVGALRVVVSKKMAATRQAVRVAMGLVLGVVVISLYLGWAIRRSLTRSVRGLSSVAKAVHENHDFTIRATKTSGDELGLLTDAFNGMLAGIQGRDRELETHRQNLEALVEARTRQLSERNDEMKLVLDNIDQGLAMIDRDGKLLGESSRTFRQAFGTPAPGTPFYTVLAKDDDKKSFELEAGYEQLIADVLPVELALDQLPRSLVREGRHYAISFTPVMHGRDLAGALLVTRDVTEELLTRRSELEQRERVQVFERVMRDRAGFQEFVEEADRLVEGLRAGTYTDEVERMRALHTLKGVTAVFDVSSVSEAAHEVEQASFQRESVLEAAALQRLFATWEAFRALVAPVLDEEGSIVNVSPEELADLIEDVRAQAPHAALLRTLVSFTDEPVAQRLRRIEDQLKRVARRLGKPEPVVTIDAGPLRVSAKGLREFWASLSHVVRNIVDHGLESEPERVKQGKPAKNRVALRAWSDTRAFTIEIADDGPGIDWALLAVKAKERGLPTRTRAELTEAIFADGVSTAGAVSQTSGRGVGMSAVRETCVALAARISVESERGKGTRFRFVFPPLVASDLEAMQAGARSPRERDSQSPVSA